MKDVIEKIRKKKSHVAVIGLGYVGLPLAVAFAKAGFKVTGIDIDEKKIDSLKRRKSYILDVSSEVLAAVGARFHARSDYGGIPDYDALILCVPTPLNKTREPDISYVLQATEKIAGGLRKGQLIVLESTTYPGTTEEVVRPILERSGLRAEKDFFLAFSPERVDPGNKRYDTTAIPKIVGGVGPRSTETTCALYRHAVRTLVPVSSAKTAEMAKLLENTFRSVNIALVNEMTRMSRHLGVDMFEVIEAAKTKPFGFMPFYPGPGIGGHCLPIDPLYLSWKSRRHGFEAQMIELASKINAEMPPYVVERLGMLLNERGVTLKNASVLVLGVTYKKDIDDVRESPALEVLQHLAESGVRVSYSDPFVPRLRLNGRVFKSKTLSAKHVSSQHAVVILTDHTKFDYGTVSDRARLILDTRNVMRRYVKKKENIFYL